MHFVPFNPDCGHDKSCLLRSCDSAFLQSAPANVKTHDANGGDELEWAEYEWGGGLPWTSLTLSRWWAAGPRIFPPLEKRLQRRQMPTEIRCLWIVSPNSTAHVIAPRPHPPTHPAMTAWRKLRGVARWGSFESF